MSLRASLLIAIWVGVIVTPLPGMASPSVQKHESARDRVPNGEGMESTLYLCQLLRNADTYKGKLVRVLAFYAIGDHEAYLYGPACEQDGSSSESSLGTQSAEVHFDKGFESRTRPETWDTFSRITADYKRSSLLRRQSRIEVTVIGGIERRRCEACEGGYRYRFSINSVEGVWLEPMPNNGMHPTSL
jgi:hypothetical protein